MHFKIVNCRLCEFLLDFFFFKVVLFNVVIIYEPEGGRGVCRGYMNPGEHRMCAYTRWYILLICVSKHYH